MRILAAPAIVLVAIITPAQAQQTVIVQPAVIRRLAVIPPVEYDHPYRRGELVEVRGRDQAEMRLGETSSAPIRCGVSATCDKSTFLRRTETVRSIEGVEALIRREA